MNTAETNFETARAELVKARIKQMRALKPRLTFVAAWNQLRRDHPALFTELSEVKSSRYPFLASTGELLDNDDQKLEPMLEDSYEVIACELASPGLTVRPPPPSEIVYMPKGTWELKALSNGVPKSVSVTVDATTGERLQQALLRRLADNVRPVAGFDHRPGPAAFIPKEFKWDTNRGVILEVDWTDAGRKAIAGRSYGYFSPVFTIGKDGQVMGLPETGEIGSLTNDPAFREIKRIAATSL